jgi:hypothetical protein
VDTDIQETADVTAEDEENHRPEMKRKTGPDFGIKNVVEKSRRGKNRWHCVQSPKSKVQSHWRVRHLKFQLRRLNWLILLITIEHQS